MNWNIVILLLCFTFNINIVFVDCGVITEAQINSDLIINCVDGKECNNNYNLNKTINLFEKRTVSNYVFIQCMNCTSANNSDCATLSNNYLKFLVRCNNIKTCYEEVDRFGETNRGCGFGSQVNKRTCTANNCNARIFPDDRLKCYQCTNAQKNCTDDQGNDGKFKNICKKYDANDRCYSLKTDNPTNSRRGCTSDNDFITDCDNNVNCRTCTGDYCNGEVIKDYTLRCAVCNSKTDENCATGKDLQKYSKTCVDDTECFVEVDSDGITKRGCGVGTEQIKETCSTENCNTKVFPAFRLQCHQCGNGTDDCTKDLSTVNKFSASCRKFILGDKCYSLYSDDKIFQRRGCISDDDYPIDCSNDENCKICNSNNCNNAIIEQRKLQCIVCNSSLEADKNCARATGGDLEKYKETCISGIKQCHVYIDSTGITHRGCGGAINNGLSCTNDNCNSQLFPSDRLQCHQCTKEMDDDCISDLTSNNKFSEICNIYNVNDECYSFYSDDENLSRRGCSSDINYPKNCSDDFNCIKCNTSNCNKNEIIQPSVNNRICFVCNSSIIDNNCATGINLDQFSRDCPNENECFVQINSKGITYRGCGRGSIEVGIKATCKTNNCNNHVLLTENGKCDSNIFYIDTVIINEK